LCRAGGIKTSGIYIVSPVAGAGAKVVHVVPVPPTAVAANLKYFSGVAVFVCVANLRPKYHIIAIAALHPLSNLLRQPLKHHTD
jgi:hypothetical protein